MGVLEEALLDNFGICPLDSSSYWFSCDIFGLIFDNISNWMRCSLFFVTVVLNWEGEMSMDLCVLWSALSSTWRDVLIPQKQDLSLYESEVNRAQFCEWPSASLKGHPKPWGTQILGLTEWESRENTYIRHLLWACGSFVRLCARNDIYTHFQRVILMAVAFFVLFVTFRYIQ